MKRVTLKDLAAMLSLSVSTVSRALSDHPDISPITKNRVHDLADQLGYRTNLQAQLLRKQHSGLIALVLPEINMFYIPSLMKSINKMISKTEYTLFTFQSNDSHKTEKEIIQQCLKWSVEGVLLSLSNETYELSHLEPLERAGIHCVLFDKSLTNPAFPTVAIDNLEASYMAVNHLIEKGHRNILGVFGSPSLSISKYRKEGYEKALNKNQIQISNENIIFVDDEKQLDFVLPPILKHNKSLSAIFTMSDELLSRTIFHLNKLEFNIPQDMSIISISDGKYPYSIYPQITHVKDSGSKMGKIACRILLDLIKQRKMDEIPTVISTKLVDLGSVRALD